MNGKPPRRNLRPRLKKMSQLKVVWQPLPGSQALAISCPCNEILYEGTRGPGKTDAQLMYFRRFVGIGYGAFWRGVIFDREYKNLDDLISKSKRWFPQFNDGARFLASKGDYKWVWPTGEELLFRQAKKKDDYNNYHGHEYPFIGWNELTKYPTPELYEALKSVNRSSFIPEEHSPIDPETGERKLLPEIPLVIFSTTNPYGPGHNWVKSEFIDPAEPGRIMKTATKVYNPRTKKEEEFVTTRVRIFGSYKENRYLSPQYIANLENISDENRRKAWLHGDWNIVAGGAFDDLWTDNLILPRFRVPATWRVDRSLDWGSSHPFSVGWWAEANGEEATLPDGSIFCPPPGTLIRINEWYGTERIGYNKGLRMSARDVAIGIKKIEAKMLAEGWIQKKVRPGPADNQIRNVTEAESDSIASKMEEEGVYWTDSDKKPGSRINGLELVRNRLEAVKKGRSEPGLLFTDNCRATLAILPTLPRDPDNEDDVDTDAEDHIYDEIRYRVLAGSNRAATGIDVRHPY